MAVLIRKRTYIQGLSWVATRPGISAPAHQNLKSLHKGLSLGSVLYTVHIVLTTHFPLKDASFKTVLVVGIVNKSYIPRPGWVGSEEPLIAWFWFGGQSSHPFDDFLHHNSSTRQILLVLFHR